MESSYREKLGKLQFTDEEISTVVKSTTILLRRHNVDGTLCPRCGNDDPAKCRVATVDDLGFITEVECDGCEVPQAPLSTICRRSHCRYEFIDDPSTLRPGDHISWHRPYLIWHHAVVTKQDPAAREITIHEYTLSGEGPYAAVVQTKFSYVQSVLQLCVFPLAYIIITQSHRLFERVILHKLCIFKSIFYIFKCEIVHL